MEKEVISQPRLERYPDAKPSISLPAPTGFLHPFARIYRRIPSCLSQLFERYAKIPQHWETRPPIERTFILREKNPRDFVTALGLSESISLNLKVGSATIFSELLFSFREDTSISAFFLSFYFTPFARVYFSSGEIFPGNEARAFFLQRSINNSTKIIRSPRLVLAFL